MVRKALLALLVASCVSCSTIQMQDNFQSCLNIFENLRNGGASGPRTYPMINFPPFIDAVRKAKLPDYRLRVIEAAARDKYFTAAQVKETVKVMTFPDYQIKSLRLMRRRIVDPDNNAQILSEIKSPSHLSQAASLLGVHRRAPGTASSGPKRVVHVPLGSSRSKSKPMVEFGPFLDQVKKAKLPDQQLSIVKVAARHRYFEADQVRLTLKAIPLPDYQIKALKVLKPRIVDPANNYRILNAILSPSHRKRAERML